LVAALFQPREPATFEPTSAAVGPWDKRIVHGAAVAALFAGQLTPTDRTLSRLTVELVAPVSLAPLTLERSGPRGGSRVQREDAVLSCDGRTVATATSVIIRRAELDLPAKALVHDSPFAADDAPPLDRPYQPAEKRVGWPSFDSQSLILEWMQVADDPRPHQWISLALPVVEGTEIRGTEIAAVAADYAQTAVSWQLPYDSWSFVNAELTLHLSREPVGSWVGIRSESVVQATGSGFNAADLYDAAGRVGRSAAAVVVERRATTD
jgi:hypothetical protein